MTMRANQIEAVHRQVGMSAERAYRRCDAPMEHETAHAALAMISERNSPGEDNRTGSLSGGSHALLREGSSSAATDCLTPSYARVPARAISEAGRREGASSAAFSAIDP